MGKRQKQARPGKVSSTTTAASRHHTPSTDESKSESKIDMNAQLFTMAIMAVVLPAMLTFIARHVGSSSDGEDNSDDTSRPHFFVRLVLSIILDAVYGEAFHTIFIPIARAISRTLPGAVVPTDHGECEREEAEQNDPAIVWPPTGANIPSDWIEMAKKRKRAKGEPLFFLNHVRGSTRLRQAVRRIAAAFGTLSMAVVMTHWVDGQNIGHIGLTISALDLALGFVVGSSVIIILFVAEVWLGWIRIIGFGEVVVPGESLTINIIWDVLFHIGVSINEEVSMRGWILVNTAAYIVSLGASGSTAMTLSVSLQAGLFALMHLGSPGQGIVGLVNLVVGGTAAALNVFLSGGLSFSLGWHFGWNIWMGHLLGLSTSGIPMSAKLISIVPHPAKSFHGGRFGPEQSPLAPVAYLLGVLALVGLYGTGGVSIWSERLESKVG
jgi:hypothetical protein